MAITKPDSAVVTAQTAKDWADMYGYGGTAYTDKYTVPSAPSTTEMEYQCDWNGWNGYYIAVPEIASIIDRKAMWTVGKGFKADKKVTDVLDKIKGNGKQTFNVIMMNGVKVYTVCGDFFAEIIRDKRGTLRNLKPLNPGTVKIIADKYGMIKKYEQWPETPELTKEAKPANIFEPDEMFHLPWNPIADQIHGNATTQKMIPIIEALKEARADMRTVFHRYVKPLLVISVDTDDTTEIAAFKAKVDQTMEKAENLIVPKGTVDNIEKVSIPQYSSLDPLPWIRDLTAQFIRAEGVPGVILGSSETQTSEAESKILYLAFQQMVEWNQKFLQEQIKSQLRLDVEFEFPASIEQDLNQDEKKDPSLKSNNPTAGKDSK